MTQRTHTNLGRRAFVGAVVGGIAALRATSDGAAETDGFCFGVVADPHASEPPRPGIEQLGDGVDKFLRCLDRYAEMSPAERPAFVLIVGDVHPEVLKGKLAGYPFDFHAVAGNHESNVERRERLRALFPHDFMKDGAKRDYYSFLHGGVRFIGLCNAGMGGEHIGQFCSELITPRGQCEWLEAELAKPEARKVVFAHIPPHREGGDANMYMSRNDGRWFLDLIRRESPEMMFFGHLHLPTEEYLIGKTRALNLRSCCWNSREPGVGCLHVRVAEAAMTIRELTTG